MLPYLSLQHRPQVQFHPLLLAGVSDNSSLLLEELVFCLNYIDGALGARGPTSVPADSHRVFSLGSYGSLLISLQGSSIHISD